jgi:hypothetical protein
MRFKERSASLLERVAEGSLDAVIDAEVLQEILHRYRALGKCAEGKAVGDAVRILVPTNASCAASRDERGKAASRSVSRPYGERCRARFRRSNPQLGIDLQF